MVTFIKICYGVGEVKSMEEGNEYIEGMNEADVDDPKAEKVRIFFRKEIAYRGCKVGHFVRLVYFVNNL